MLNRYEVISKLGSGGFAQVYRAFDTRMQREVAIKKIELGRHSAEKVLREARTVALLNHPNIVTIHEFEEGDDECYLIMELIDGVPLSCILDELAPLSPGEAITVAIEVCRALEAAHLNGIVHRDIKPENIMVAFSGRLKVMDFGIARFKGTSTKTSTSIVGTFAYMSPEQARGEEVDERSDLFSLGTVLYEMLTDSVPFRADSAAQALNRVQALAPEPPSALNPAVEGGLDEVIMRALEKDPGRRYQSASELCESLKNLLPNPGSTERVLSGLAGECATPETEALEHTEHTGFRRRLWRAIGAGERYAKVLVATLVAYPFYPLLNSWLQVPAQVASAGAALIFILVLARPDIGIGLAFLLLSLALIKHSPAMALMSVILLVPYWRLVSKRWPVLSVIPAGGAALALLGVPFVFPVLAGLFAGPAAAALASALGCLSFEFLNIFLEKGTSPEVIKSYGAWAALRGEANPAHAAALILGPFINDRLLALQPVLWAAVSAITSLAKGARRWGLGVISGFFSLVMGYQGLASAFKPNSIDMDALMQTLSFSLIILLLLLILRPPAPDKPDILFEAKADEEMIRPGLTETGSVEVRL